MKILIADDNKQITSILSEYAKKEGYLPIVAFDGEEAMIKYRTENPDILLLDIMMPKKDGFQLCEEIRKESNVPIIIITAKCEDFEKIMGLEIGADDYIVKPFSVEEVMARVKTIMRRINCSEKESKTFVYSNLKIDIENYTVRVDDVDIYLTKKELEILWILANNSSKVFSRDNLLDSVWGFDYFGDTRTVDSHIKRLRAKLDKQNHNDWDIKTVWGVGYKFEIIN